MEDLNPEQQNIALQIINAVTENGPNLLFLQGAAGTGKTFTVRTIIHYLRSQGRKCLICGTTGIAAVQYPGGTTLHSLFHLGIDEEWRKGFRSNIGQQTRVDKRFYSSVTSYNCHRCYLATHIASLPDSLPGHNFSLKLAKDKPEKSNTGQILFLDSESQ
jgi:Cdc6-like AAA superfamily ATPase